MVVQHNLTAMNSNRMLGVTTKTQAKSTEKLSSGYKINRAADDAAGLSISEKMRKQIRGLTQASLNAQDGISAVQTAEGALTEVHDMLQRMNELAVKAGNGTMSADDRNYVQNEIDQLVNEIDRVSETTKFNETYLLKGDAASNGNKKTFAANDVLGTVDGVTVAAKGATQAELTDGKEIKIGTVEVVSSDATNFTIADDAAQKKAENVVKITSDGTNATVTLKDGTEVTKAIADITKDYGIEAKAAGSATISKQLKVETTDASVTGAYTGNLNDLKAGDAVNVKLAIGASGSTALSSSEKALILSFQVGADTTAENKIEVSLESMSAKGIGVNGLQVNGKDSTNADAAVKTIASAIQKVSTQRSALGAVQNRLEHTINNLDNVVENTTSAESQIRDTDMATEMVKYSNNNILAQAGQAMLAQSNQANQGVLSLLQ
ncbi:flagellin [Suilimivivens sp.]|uniref:flagellin N-terminal helical domain-containing protein n=1 Tax=Suilimivivens sp. TaxID=2981669 RepID=UPI00307C058E